MVVVGLSVDKKWHLTTQKLSVGQAYDNLFDSF